MKRKLLGVFICSIILMVTVIPVKAQEVPSNTVTITYFDSEEAVEEELDRLIVAEVAEIQKKATLKDTDISTYTSKGGSNWKTEYGTTKTKVVGGYASGQLSGGYSFGSNGGFLYYNPDGGANISFSINFGVGFGIYSGSVGIGVGSKQNIGAGVNVPGDGHYYKIYAQKTMKVRPYTVYNKVNGVWKKYHTGFSQTVYSVSSTAKRVS